MNTLVKSGVSAVFPAGAVEAKLREELLGVAASTAEMHAITLPATVNEKYAAGIQLDSLDVVDVLLSIEKIVDFTLKDHLVKAGGYPSINAAVEHLVPRIKSAWDKHVAKGSKK